MFTIERVLLARRNSDGKFLSLLEDRNATSFCFVDDPSKAKRIYPLDESQFQKPKEATHYFENSYRARTMWLVDCAMVPYKISTTVECEPMGFGK
jgi:hypothetical protein